MQAADYYDLHPWFPDDVPFYRSLVTTDDSVLDLGCGTGRVLIPLGPLCGTIQGIENSERMVEIGREKLSEANLTNARIDQANITSFSLERTFDRIIAPFRVFEWIVSDQSISEFFECVRAHLSTNGKCILNARHSKLTPDEMAGRWRPGVLNRSWEKKLDGKRVVASWVLKKLDVDRSILYTQNIYQELEGDELVDESREDCALRFYDAAGFRDVIEENGFVVYRTWGGYDGEQYEEGSELIGELG